MSVPPAWKFNGHVFGEFSFEMICDIFLKVGQNHLFFDLGQKEKPVPLGTGVHKLQRQM